MYIVGDGEESKGAGDDVCDEGVEGIVEWCKSVVCVADEI